MGATGILGSLCKSAVEGYEIHMGQSVPYEEITEFTSGKTGYCSGNVYGTYIHGFFDKKEITEGVVKSIAASVGKTLHMGEIRDYKEFMDSQYDILAKGLRECLDMDYIYEIMGLNNDKG